MTTPATPTPFGQALFEYMDREHGVILLENEIGEIIRLCDPLQATPLASAKPALDLLRENEESRGSLERATHQLSLPRVCDQDEITTLRERVKELEKSLEFYTQPPCTP